MCKSTCKTSIDRSHLAHLECCFGSQKPYSLGKGEKSTLHSAGVDFSLIPAETQNFSIAEVWDLKLCMFGRWSVENSCRFKFVRWPEVARWRNLENPDAPWGLHQARGFWLEVTLDMPEANQEHSLPQTRSILAEQTLPVSTALSHLAVLALGCPAGRTLNS